MRAPERRAQLLEVARLAFGRNGFHGVSMEEVAREAGVTKPVLYDHFSSKEALFLALLDADSTALEERVRAALQAPTGNRQRIRASFQAYFDFVDEHAEGFKLVMQEAQYPRFLSSSVNGVRGRIHAEVADLIVRESKGSVGEDDALTIALGLISMVETGAQRNPGGPRADRARQVEVLVQLAWRGMTALEQ
jgi:AcrR family transcriptional regulator